MSHPYTQQWNTVLAALDEIDHFADENGPVRLGDGHDAQDHLASTMLEMHRKGLIRDFAELMTALIRIKVAGLVVIAEAEAAGETVDVDALMAEAVKPLGYLLFSGRFRDEEDQDHG